MDQRVTGHYFSFGDENSLIKSVMQMESPAILVAYLDLIGGNFDGMTVHKHRLEVYMRPNNRAVGIRPDGKQFATMQHLWWLMMNKPVGGLDEGPNIRNVELANGDLQLMDNPTLIHRTDELGADFFIGSLVFPEKGDV